MFGKAKRILGDMRRKHIAHGDTDEVLCVVSIGLEEFADALEKCTSLIDEKLEEVLLEIKELKPEGRA